MNSYNRVILIGNLTSKPILRNVPGGYVLTEFGLAINRDVKDKNGAKRKASVFVDIVVWGKAAVNCVKCLDKGQNIHVEGRLQYQKWTDKQTGKPRTKHNVVADNVIFLDKPTATTPSQPISTSSPTSSVAAEIPAQTAQSAALPATDTIVKAAPATQTNAPAEKVPWYHQDSKEYTDGYYNDQSFDAEAFGGPFRDEQLIYREEINHDEWKDKVREYNELLVQSVRSDLSQEDHDDIGQRLQELSMEIEEMNECTQVAEKLSQSRQ